VPKKKSPGFRYIIEDISPERPKRPKYPIEDIYDETDPCRTVRGINVCNEKIRYHEKQRLKLCGLHATNNLLQNTTTARLFTKEDFDTECKRLKLLDLPYKVCDDDGFYHASVIEHSLKKIGLLSEKLDNQVKFRFVMEMMRKYHNMYFLGIIALYTETGGTKHFVTIIYRKKKYFIIDSESPSGNAYAVKDEDDVVRYFGPSLLVALGIHIR
jgi:josephin